MALSIIGTPAVGSSTTITLPTHDVGDIIIICAARANATQTSVPSAGGSVPDWGTAIASGTGTSTSMRVHAAIASSSSHTSGTWTNAGRMAVIVLRGQHASPIGGTAYGSGNTGTSVVAPSVTQSDTSGAAMLLHFMHASSINSAWASAPAGYTSQASQATNFAQGICLLTKDSTTSDGSVSRGTITASSVYSGASVEILAAADATSSGAFFAMF